MPKNPKDNNHAELYNRVGNENVYNFYPGTCVLPLAEDPPTDPTELAAWSPVVVLRLHAPFRVRHHSYIADKKNAPPPAPSPGDTGSFVFLGGAMRVVNTLSATFRSFDWSVACSFAYVESCVSRPEDGLVLGSPPFNWTSADEEVAKGYSIPPLGAAAHAGKPVLAGVRQGNYIVANPTTGELKPVWSYTIPQFYPGVLFDTNMANGGDPVV